MYTFIGKIPQIDELADMDVRRLVSTNFFPMLAVKQMYKQGAHCPITSASPLFLFESGLSASLNEVPVEFHSFFTAIAQTAPDFHSSVEWDLPSLVSLLVLQLLRTKLEKPVGSNGGRGASAAKRRDSGNRVDTVAVALSDGFDNEAAIEKLYGECGEGQCYI